MLMRERLQQYIFLMRLDKPIGIMLLLWPTLWSLWLASHGKPEIKIFFIFIVGVILMRSAGCVVNDFSDRHLDGLVKRTQHRPLVTGKVSSLEALMIAFILSLIAFLLVLQCNLLTISLAFIGAGITIVYPLMKRVTHLPQLGLGVAFSWGIPMSFAAQTGELSLHVWFLFLTAMIWPLIYDSMYAMIDRDDDIKIGIKSTAILFDAKDCLIIGLLQSLFVVMLIIVGLMFRLHIAFYISLIFVSLLFIYQQWLIKDRDIKRCFAAFLNNNLVGLTIFIGVSLSCLT